MIERLDNCEKQLSGERWQEGSELTERWKERFRDRNLKQKKCVPVDCVTQSRGEGASMERM